MMNKKPLLRGFCPICNKIIMNKQKTEYINGGFEFWVEFSDGSRAAFAICEECYGKITPEQLDDIMQSQIVNWGIEITKQMIWFYERAAHLRITKHARTKDELTNSN